MKISPERKFKPHGTCCRFLANIDGADVYIHRDVGGRRYFAISPAVSLMIDEAFQISEETSIDDLIKIYTQQLMLRKLGGV